MKKICFFVHNLSHAGGINCVIAALTSALAEDNAVWVASMETESGSSYPLDPRVHTQFFHAEGLRLRQAAAKLYAPVRNFVRQQRFDAVFLAGYYTSILAPGLRASTGARLVFYDHGTLAQGAGDRTFRLMCRMGATLCHRTVVLTQRNLEAYVSQFHIPRRKLMCIPNWIDSDCPHSDRYCEDSRKIMAAGRFSEEKRYDLLLRAFAMVVSRHPDWSLDLYGDGELRPQLEELIRELQLQDHVALPGMCQNLMCRYGEYAMLVLSSWREGLPMVLLEAKLNRLPLVSFDIDTGPREIIRHEVDGLLVPSGDVEGLAEAICRLVEDSRLRKQMSDNSREDIYRFDKKTILRQWQRLLEELAG